MAGQAINLFDLEEVARQNLDKNGYVFIAGYSTDKIILRGTRAVFDSIMLRPRVLVAVGQRDTRTTVLGQRIDFSVLLDPASGPGARNHASSTWAPR